MAFYGVHMRSTVSTAMLENQSLLSIEVNLPLISSVCSNPSIIRTTYKIGRWNKLKCCLSVYCLWSLESKTELLPRYIKTQQTCLNLDYVNMPKN
ncbi:hypothetical protein Csa_019080 [Cucumis sativus]|uniref:Uncharacterized protein n=1 Tax=Cucumis sativus TaxID=3659 RepID=A0A0A0KGW9_CUCSA|nr:hypothetical protein Csa_019080 [Cucumis sativus]